MVLHSVFDALAAGCDHGRGAGRVAGGDDQDLAGHLAVDVDQDELLRPGQLHADPEPLVVLLVDHHVVGSGRADGVPPDPVRPPGVIHCHVEQHRGVGRPGGAVEGVGHLVGQQLAGGQVLHAQGEPLVPGEVGGVGQPATVRADVERAQREEVVPLGQEVAVEQHLLAVEPGAVGADRRLDLPVADRAAAVHPILLALDSPGVVPVPTLAGRHGQVGLPGALAGLLEQRRAQLGQVRRTRVGVRVLGGQVGDRLRVVLGGEPGVLVDDGVAVVGALAGHPLRRGRGSLGGHGGHVTGRHPLYAGPAASR